MKSLASPLAWLLLLQAVALLGWWSARRRNWDARERYAYRNLVATTILIALISTRPFAMLVERALYVPDSKGAAPEVIFVLADGYQRGASPEDDTPTIVETERAAAAARWWSERRTGLVVHSGRNGALDRPAGELGQLGARILTRHGVPPDSVRIDSLSRNTREHPRAAIQLGFAVRSTRVGIVSSRWHLIRARREFARVFPSVQWRAADDHASAFAWDDLIPDADWLGVTSRAVKEMVGIVTYTIRGGAIGELAEPDPVR